MEEYGSQLWRGLPILSCRAEYKSDMNRREFMKVAAASVLAATADGVKAKVLDTPQGEAERGLGVRFLGTGAADWNGPDARGEHRRLSSLLLEREILIDFTPTDVEMLPEGCNPKTIFYTHSHGDHYHHATALKAGIEQVYLSESWYDIAVLDFRRAAAELKLPMPEIHPLRIGEGVTIGEITITPLPASHATGYRFEQLLHHPHRKALLELCDVLVDGPFLMEERDISLHFRGSRNQRVIDVPTSLEKGEIKLLDFAHQ